MMNRRIVLLVDDDVTGTAIRSLMYQEEGFIAFTTFCGQEAIKLCEHLPVHLVVLDMQMPEMDGLEVAKRIRSIRSSIPIVIHSGLVDVPWQGIADAYVEKGTDFSYLLAISSKLSGLIPKTSGLEAHAEIPYPMNV